MFANRFSNNRRFMAPRGEFCKPCNIHYYYYCDPEYTDSDGQNVFTLNFMNKMNLTSNILTNKYFTTSQNACYQNFRDDLKDFVVGSPQLDTTNDKIAYFHPTNMQSANKISDMYTYLIDLIKRFFSSWKNPAQEQKLRMVESSRPEADHSNIDKNNHLIIEDCNLITNESHCIKISTKNRKTCCDNFNNSTLNPIKPCLKMNTVDTCKIMDEYDLCSSKYSREVSRLKSLKKKKQRRMATQAKKRQYNRDTDRRMQHKDWNKNKIDIEDDLDEALTKNCRILDCYDNGDLLLQSEKLLLLENCRNIVQSSPTLKISMPLVINTNSLIVSPDEIISSSIEDSHPIRSRNVSECESEDSFIVFASDNDEYEFDDQESLSSYFEDESTDDDEDAIQKSHTTSAKKVSFANEKELCKVHHLVKWSYAYQAARKGPWEECARDRERFMLRIKDLESKLNKVFDPKLRKRIYNERFSAQSTKTKSVMSSKVKCKMQPLK